MYRTKTVGDAAESGFVQADIITFDCADRNCLSQTTTPAQAFGFKASNTSQHLYELHSPSSPRAGDKTSRASTLKSQNRIGSLQHPRPSPRLAPPFLQISVFSLSIRAPFFKDLTPWQGIGDPELATTGPVCSDRSAPFRQMKQEE